MSLTSYRAAPPRDGHEALCDRMRQLEAERDALQKAEDAVEAPPAIAIHPNLAELYRRRVADLEKLLLDPELGSEAMDLIRSMITGITVVPREDAEGVHLELAGDLARILHLCSTSSMQNAQAVAGAGRFNVSYKVSVVAGTRNQRMLQLIEQRIPRIAA